MSRQFDVAIVGAGVVGCAIARQLARYDLRIALIDAAEDVAMGASRANSAIVHAGYDCPPGSVEARMNVLGNALYRQWCDELDVPFKRCGSFVIGFGPEDEKVLQNLYDRGSCPAARRAAWSPRCRKPSPWRSSPPPPASPAPIR